MFRKNADALCEIIQCTFSIFFHYKMQHIISKPQSHIGSRREFINAFYYNVASQEHGGRGKCSWHYGTYGLRFTYVYTHAKPDFTAAVYNAGNQKSQIIRSLLEEIYSRRRRRRFPYIYRNARSVVLVWTRPRLVKARAVKAVHPRIPRSERQRYFRFVSIFQTANLPRRWILRVQILSKTPGNF